MGGNNSNFSFLSAEFPLLYELSSSAEHYLHSDPAACLFKLRLFCETLTSDIIDLTHLKTSHLNSGPAQTQFERINLIAKSFKLNPDVTKAFHQLRMVANQAVHGKADSGSPQDAADCLRLSWYLSRWFYRAFGRNKQQLAGLTFTPPPKQPDKAALVAAYEQQLKEQERTIARLRQEQTERDAQLQQEFEQRERELIAKFKRGDFAAAKLNKEAAAETLRLKKDPSAVETLTALPANFFVDDKAGSELAAAAGVEASAIAGDEVLARRIIDDMLKEAGWKVDSVTLTYAKGARPVRNLDQAIAEYPVKGGRADYVLFCGLKPVAVLEAKKGSLGTSGKLEQAERYSINFDFTSDPRLQRPFKEEAGPWPAAGGECYQIPFVLAANGNPYYSYDPELSGTWMRDVRQSCNLRCPVGAIPSPADFLGLLALDKQQAAARLAAEPMDYLKLRPYQEQAVRAAEQQLVQGRRHLLISMATGTGKTLVARGLIYRLLKAGLYKRILYLVDRISLADQAAAMFDEDPVEGSHKFSQIYAVNRSDSFEVNSETKVQIATVQGLVRRLFAGENMLSAGMFDCIIVDEAHRSYTLDKKAAQSTRTLFNFLGEDDYLAVYRRALDFFPAAVIGFTATPSEQSRQIFDAPIYSYSYRDAVLDGYLVDCCPPVIFKTELSEKGIYVAKNSVVKVFKSRLGRVTEKRMPADLTFTLKDFNTRIKASSFNQVICEQLVQDPRIDITSPRKTLIFCTRDDHADEIKLILDRLYREKYGEKYDQRAVMKITGKSVDQDQLIRDFRLQKYPNIAITVDLLTTGIDIPSICNLVFLRCVTSKVLYRQMLGRATRLCPQIDKESFNIFDAAGVSELDLEDDMVTVDPQSGSQGEAELTNEQIVKVLTSPQLRKAAQQLQGAGAAASDDAGADSAEGVGSAGDLTRLFILRLQKLMDKAQRRRRSYPEIDELMLRIEQIFAAEQGQIRKVLQNLSMQRLSELLQAEPRLPELMDDLRRLCTDGSEIILSNAPDQITSVTRSYGKAGEDGAAVVQRLAALLQRAQQAAAQGPEESTAHTAAAPAASAEQQTDEAAADALSASQAALLRLAAEQPEALNYAQLKELDALLFDHELSASRLQTALAEVGLLAGADFNLLDALQVVKRGQSVPPHRARVQQALAQVLEENELTEKERSLLHQAATLLNTELIFDADRFNARLIDSGGLKRMRRICPRFDELTARIARLSWTFQP